MQRMHPLLRAALFVCPGEFRNHCAREIAADLDRHRAAPLPFWLTCANVAWTGILLHAESFGRDVAFAARTLRKAPMFATVATLAIALAIGANVAVTSVLQGVLLRPLPYPHANRIVAIGCDGATITCSYLDARDYGAGETTLSQFGVRGDDEVALTGVPVPVNLYGSMVDAGYFRVLSAQPELGRLFTTADLGTKRVVLSDAAWRTYFHADPSIIGRTVTLDANAYIVIGVAPATLRDLTQQGLKRFAFWVPVNTHDPMILSRGAIGLEVWGVLRPRVSTAAAQADGRRVMSGIVHRFPAAHANASPAVVLGALNLLVGPVRQILWLLYAAVTVLLVIACANIVNLTLVRAAARDRELVVRSALGATRTRIAAQLCTEMGVIALAGGALGVALGWLGLRLFDTLGSGMIPRWDAVHVDAGVIAYVAAIAIVTSLLTGAIPAILQRKDLASGLKAAGRSGDASGAKKLRIALVVAEIALTVGLTTCAGLTLRSFVMLTHVTLGFNPSLLYAVATPSDSTQKVGYATELRNDEAVTGAVRAIPNVVGASMSTIMPFSGGNFTVGTTFPGRPGVASLNGDAVDPSYFSVMDIPLLRGRFFTPADDAHAPSVAIVTASLARRYFGTLDVIGRRMKPGFGTPLSPSETRTIVGVVGDTRGDFDQSMQPRFYMPSRQLGAGNEIIVRLKASDPHFADEVHAAYRRLNPAYPAPEVDSFDAVLQTSAERRQGTAMLFGVLACIALLLAIAGVYAVTAYSVQQRTREFGVRKAVGASDAHVLTGVVVDAMRQGALGVVIGLGLAAIGSRMLGSLLFKTSTLDPVTYVAVVGLLFGCTVLAALVPAARATRVDPAAALHYE
ncbi:MAG TPA: ABC transporter permease [Candidatus Baltobacteraceae bacterium]|nr:ABC transporter permease [Candidatus Baltobacteraceae bacterium]